MIESLEQLTKVKDVQNSTLKMGYNEEDFIVTRTEKPNCILEFIAPKGFVRSPFTRPKKMAKQYKFKLDTF